MSDRPCLVLVGGFLGAGKTTLILAAARELSRRGMKAAFIANDQGESLVDTSFARHSGIASDEVTGGCFCCRFSDFLDAAGRLRAHAPDVIFAEATGSCTDISSTVIRPLRELYAADFQLAPFTVCVDPARAKEFAANQANTHLLFLFRNQLDESDLVLYTKADLYPDAPAAPNARYVSAQTGDGVEAWLDEVLACRIAPGARVLDIDYDRYARAEAALAWLNMKAVVECRPAVSPARLLGPLVDRIAGSVRVVHLKAIDQSESGFLKAAMVNSYDEPQIEGSLDSSPAWRHEILLNLRAVGHPEPVQMAVEEAMAELGGHIVNQQIACFTPAPPKRPVWPPAGHRSS